MPGRSGARFLVTATLLALGLGGCAGHSRINSPTGDGAEWFNVTCPWGSEGCYEEAAEACPNGYDVDQRSTKAGKPRNFSAWRNTLIRCKRPGEGTTADEGASPPAKPASTSKKTSGPAPDADSGELKVVQSARWRIKVPTGWTVQKGSKSVVVDDGGSHRVMLSTEKTTSSLSELATQRFKGWHNHHDTMLGTRDATVAEDFDGSSQSISILMIVDDVAYQLTCVDIGKGNTSNLCRGIVLSLRVEDAQ